jgi:hypothetical protein
MEKFRGKLTQGKEIAAMRKIIFNVCNFMRMEAVKFTRKDQSEGCLRITVQKCVHGTVMANAVWKEGSSVGQKGKGSYLFKARMIVEYKIFPVFLKDRQEEGEWKGVGYSLDYKDISKGVLHATTRRLLLH